MATTAVARHRIEFARGEGTSPSSLGRARPRVLPVDGGDPAPPSLHPRRREVDRRGLSGLMAGDADREVGLRRLPGHRSRRRPQLGRSPTRVPH